ncbi:MAG: hypothetical protein LBS49_00005, partial [Candidatus Accumulibacter sp.]|nr:hypothetical protein [Accumulibacter sp.]
MHSDDDDYRGLFHPKALFGSASGFVAGFLPPYLVNRRSASRATAGKFHRCSYSIAIPLTPLMFRSTSSGPDQSTERLTSLPSGVISLKGEVSKRSWFSMNPRRYKGRLRAAVGDSGVEAGVLNAPVDP